MKIKTRTRTVSTVEIDGIEAELEMPPHSEVSILAERVGDLLVVAYLVQDDSSGQSVEDLMGDCMGQLYSFHRHAGRDKHQAGLAALGCDVYGEIDEDIEPDVDAVLLDCYEHGQQVWSPSGDGTQCQFDTAGGAGVWVPDESLRTQLDSDGLLGLNRRKQAVKYCKQFLNQYNAINSGDVYGCVTQVFDMYVDDGEPAWLPRDDHDSCWGFVGHAYALESLKSDYFDHVITTLKKETETV